MMKTYNMSVLLYFFMALSISISDDSTIDNNQVTKKEHIEGGPHVQHDGDHDNIVDYRTWLAASGSILLISLCGVFGVLVVPIMQKMYYQYLVQFLVAMAVGSLVGDALIHLLPHALLPDDHGVHGQQHQHNEDLHIDSRAVWIGFVAAVSILGFFFFEKSINLLCEVKRRKHQKHGKDETTVAEVGERNRCMNE